RVCVSRRVLVVWREFWVVLFLFCSGPRDRRDLHSFPTRRSSDLFALIAGAAAGDDVRPRLAAALDDGHDVVERELAARRAPAHRSEEHTSELQSRENLVCRLLLEKKKSR